MSYDDYRTHFRYFNTHEGYASACRYLAFDADRWIGFEDYKHKIEEEINKISKGFNENLNMVDLCCGEYS